MAAKFDIDYEEDSQFSGDEYLAEEAPKKSNLKRGTKKRVVTVPIGGGDKSRSSKGEVYPPPDSWSWRKYGQKPIKGSPYPRGYYKCSSSKGCPARKQVERSRLDPTSLLITYSCDHNHHLPNTTKNHHQPPAPTTTSTVSTSPSSSTATTPPASFPPEEYAAFANQPDIEPPDTSFVELAGELGWLCDVESMTDGTTLVGPAWAHAEVEVFMPIGEEDELLFGDLGDLPESSVVFRRCNVEAPCCGGTG